MKTVFGAVALCFAASLPAAAQEHGFQDELLDRLAGTWVMEGTIAGDAIVHDLVAEWVLDHQYLRFHEVARGTEPDGTPLDGTPLYEAIVFIGWNLASSQYTCLWLDSTGGSGLDVPVVIGHTKRSGDRLPFVFDTGDGSLIHNTFAYSRDTDTWAWAIDNESAGERTAFARVTLRRQ